MAYIDFISSLHTRTKRDYLSRINDLEYPKAYAAKLAKKWGYDYWDGDRRINYGGYQYIEGYWGKVAKKMKDYYNLPENPKILDVGCGKGYLLFDFLKILPNSEIFGIDISKYAIQNSKKEIRQYLQVGNANQLPWADNYFDLVYSINTFHNLYNYELEEALKEFERVGKQNKYICVESYRTEEEKMNLLYWQVTCEAFCNPKEWEWWFNHAGYTGDHSFIFFD